MSTITGFRASSIISIACGMSLLLACGDDGGGNADETDAASGIDAAVGLDATPAADAADGALGAPQNFTATYSASPFAVDLAWEAPATGTPASYLLARSNTSSPGTGPVDGTTYALDDVIDGWTVIDIGSDLLHSDTAPTADQNNFYQLWAVDAASSYGPPATAEALAPLPPQTTSLQISDLGGTPTVTVLTQPGNFTLSGTATYDADTDEVVLSLTVTSGMTRLVYNLKASVTAVGQGTASSDGSFGGNPTAYYGPNALDIAASATRDFTISAVDGAVDPLTVDLTLTNHRSMTSTFAAGARDLFFTDISGGSFTDNTAFGGSLTNDLSFGNGNFMDGVFTPDGRHLIAAQRNMPTLMKIDMTTLSGAATADLSSDTSNVGYVGAVALSPDALSVYALVVTGTHRFGDDPGSNVGPSLRAATLDLDLVKLDTATLTEQARLPLVVDSAEHIKAHRIAVTPDGATAIALSSIPDATVPVAAATFINLGTFAVDTTLDLSATAANPRAIAINPAGTTAAVTYANDPADGSITLIDVLAKTTSNITPTAPGDYGKWGTGVFWGPDGRLYLTDADTNGQDLGVRPSMSVWNPSDDTWVHVIDDVGICNLTWSDDGATLLFLEEENSLLRGLDATTLAPVDVDGKASIPASAGFGTHLQQETPF